MTSPESPDERRFQSRREAEPPFEVSRRRHQLACARSEPDSVRRPGHASSCRRQHLDLEHLGEDGTLHIDGSVEEGLAGIDGIQTGEAVDCWMATAIRSSISVSSSVTESVTFRSCWPVIRRSA